MARKISMIAALGNNNVIGKDNQLPWHLPKDMRFFKAQTLHHPIIMGRKSFESLGKPLKDRSNIVITRNKDFQAEGIVVVHSFEEAIDHAFKENEQIFITGGEQIYRLALPQATHLVLTHVEASPEGDAFFPEVNWEEWEKLSEETHAPDEKHAYPFRFVEYGRGVKGKL